MTRTRTPAPAAEVRQWARDKGFRVGTRGHLPPEVIKAYNRSHRKVFIDRNPFNGHQEESSDA